MAKQVARTVNQVTSVVNKPLLEPAKVIANATKDIPVFNIVSRGVASAIDTPTQISGAIIDPSKKGEATQTTIEGVKGGLVVASAFVGGAGVGTVAGLGQGMAGASIMSTALQKGLTVGALAGLGEGLGYLPSGSAGFVDSLPNFNGGGSAPRGGGGGAAPQIPDDAGQPIYAARSGKDYTLFFAASVAVIFLLVRGV